MVEAAIRATLQLKSNDDATLRVKYSERERTIFKIICMGRDSFAGERVSTDLILKIMKRHEKNVTRIMVNQATRSLIEKARANKESFEILSARKSKSILKEYWLEEGKYVRRNPRSFD